MEKVSWLGAHCSGRDVLYLFWDGRRVLDCARMWMEEGCLAVVEWRGFAGWGLHYGVWEVSAWVDGVLSSFPDLSCIVPDY